MSEAEKLKGPPDHPPTRRSKRLGKSGEQPRPKGLERFVENGTASNDVPELKTVEDLTTALGEEANSVLAESNNPPDSEPQRAKDSDTFAIVGQNGGGGDGEGPKGPEGEQSLERISPSPTLERTRDVIEADPNLSFSIRTPALFPHQTVLDGFRRDWWSPSHIKTINRIQTVYDVPMENYKDHYDHISTFKGGYVAGRIPLENLGLIAGYEGHDTIRDLFRQFQRTRDRRGQLIRVPIVNHGNEYNIARVMDWGPGDGDFIRRFAKYKKGADPFIVQLENAVNGRDTIDADEVRRYIEEGEQAIKEQIDRGQVDRNIIAIDNAEGFVTPLQRNRIHAFKVDMDIDDETFEQAMESQGVKRHSIHLHNAGMIMDRIDYDSLKRKLKMYSLKDGTSRVIFTVSLPMQRLSDKDTLRDKVKTFENWTATDDPRNLMTAENELRPEFADLGEKEGKRAQALYHLLADLAGDGIVPYSVGEQPYEVYCTHCIAEKAETIRSDYQHLKDVEFECDEDNELRDRVFSDDPEVRIPDNQLVGFRQRYNVFVIAAHVLPDVEVE